MSDPTARAKNLVARRQEYRCMICGLYLLTSATPHSFHHRLMRSQGHGYAGLHQPGNLILLCGTGTTGCHGYVHAHPAESYDNGWLVHIDGNPLTQPVRDKFHGRILLDDTGDWREA